MASSISQHLIVALALCGSAAPATQEQKLVVLNFPEPVPLKVLLDYVSKSLSLNILYDEAQVGVTVTIRSPVSVPTECLLPLLRGILKSKQLALIDDVTPGWLRVVKAENLQRETRELRSDQLVPDASATRIITQMVLLKSADLQRITEVITPFLSLDKASIIPVPEKRMLIITDYESSIARALKIIELVDQAPVDTSVKIVVVTHVDPTKLAAQVTGLLAEKQRMGGSKEAPPVSIKANPGDRSVLLLGTERAIEEAQQFVALFDQPSASEMTANRYMPRHISAERFSRLINELLGAGAAASSAEAKSRVVPDTEANAVYVSAIPDFHKQVAKLLEDVDVVPAETSRPLRLYRPKNRKAKELMEALSSFLGEDSHRSSKSSAIVPQLEIESAATVANRPGSLPQPKTTARTTSQPTVEGTFPSQRVEGDMFTLALDEPTNTILVMAAPQIHQQIERLMEELDCRRKQVVIEMTLVEVSANKNLNWGVELQTYDLGDAWDYHLFSSFGLSQTDPMTGSRVASGGLGANGILLSPDEIPIILQALAIRTDSRIVSSPKITVMDNAQGSLKSIDEAPFTSVNASDTVATTSFGGFESAGTELSVTPHIIDPEHLTLEYKLTFSNFTGTSSSATIPPPRTSNNFSSNIEIPSGYTVVVGGLVVERKSNSVSEVPFLGRVPGLGFFFQNSQVTRSKARLYAFIRPVILNDDEFADLKCLTKHDLEDADLSSKDFPPCVPLLMQ